MQIVAGDIGGTNARLALCDVGDDGRVDVKRVQVYPSADFAGLAEIVARFVDEGEGEPTAACFAVPGPVRRGRAQTTNLPWLVESAQLAEVESPGIPLWFAHGPIIIGFLLLVFRFLQVMYRLATGEIDTMQMADEAKEALEEVEHQHLAEAEHGATGGDRK